MAVNYFDYKTYHNQVFKIKQTDQGLMKAIEKPDTFNPPAKSIKFNKPSLSLISKIEGLLTAPEISIEIFLIGINIISLLSYVISVKLFVIQFKISWFLAGVFFPNAGSASIFFAKSMLGASIPC